MQIFEVTAKGKVDDLIIGKLTETGNVYFGMPDASYVGFSLMRQHWHGPISHILGKRSSLCR